MTFWSLANIDIWLLAGVIFSVFWHIYKAAQHDTEKHEKRINELEYDVDVLYNKIKKLRGRIR